MLTEPRIILRAAQPYAGIAAQVTIAELGTGIVPQLHETVMRWLNERGATPVDVPFIRYRVIDMAAKLQVELGWPTTELLTGSAPVICDVLPAGRYASVVYTGPYEGNGLFEANGALIEWADATGVKLDRWQETEGEAFRARLERYLRDPGNEPDPALYETEVSIRVAD